MILWAATYLAPLAVLLGLVFSGLSDPSARDRIRRALTMAAPVATLPAIALAAAPGSASPGPSIDWLLLGTRLDMDGFARPLTLVAALLYAAALATIARWGTLSDAPPGDRPGAPGSDPPAVDGPGAPALSGFLLAAYLGNITVYSAADTATFYLAFAVMSFSAFGAIVHDRSRKAHFASRLYLVMSVLSEVSVLVAMMMITAAAGPLIADAPAAVAGHPLSGLIIFLLIAGFGVKAGTVPLHIWLPLAHPAAPPAASAVLSGAMVKSGLLGWLRFLPMGEEPQTTAAMTLLLLSLTGTFAAAIVGALQNDPKVVLAYSTISQMGFIGAVVAVGMLRPELAAACAWAAVIYAVHHGLAKGALFLGYPLWAGARRRLSDWAVIAGLVVAGAAVAGAPFTSGALGKYVSKQAVEGLEVGGLPLDSLLPLVATGSTVLLVRFGLLLHRDRGSEREGGRVALGAWFALVVAGVIVPWFIGAYRTPLDPPAAEAPVLWDATWPLLLGAAIATALFLAGRAFSEPADPLIPPGDVLEPEMALARSVSRAAVGADDRFHELSDAGKRRITGAIATSARGVRGAVSRVEARLSVDAASGAALLFLVAVFLILVALAGGAR